MKLKENIINVICDVLDMATSCGTNLVTPFLKFEQGDAMLAFINSVYQALIIMGVGMLIVYLLLDLNKTVFMSGSNVTLQAMFSPLIKFACGYIVITKGGTIIGYFLSFNNWWVDFCDGLGVTGTGGVDPLAFRNGITTMIEDMGVVEVCLTFLPFFLCWIISSGLQLVFIYKALAWKLELSLRIAIAPVCFGDIYDGKGGGTLRYLKKILSMCLYAGGMVLVIKFGMVMYYDLWGAMQDAVIGMQSPASDPNFWADAGSGLAGILSVVPLVALALVTPIIEIGAIKAVKQICDDVLA